MSDKVKNNEELDYSQNADSLHGLSERNKIRDKISMYAGGSDQETGILTMFREPIDNSIDEISYLIRKGETPQKLIIKVDSKNNICSVRDFGRGIPYVKDKNNVSTLEKCFTILHMGGKHDNNSKHLLQENLDLSKTNSAYQMSSGINGIGSKINSFASKFFHAVVFNETNNEKAYISFDNGYLVTNDKNESVEIVSLEKDIDIFNKNIDSFVLDSKDINGEQKRGSILIYQPSIKDDEFDEENVFDVGVKFDKDMIINQIKYLPYLTPGLTIELYYDEEKVIFEEKNEFKSCVVEYAEKLKQEMMIDTVYFKEHMVFAKNLTNNSQPKVYSLEDFAKLPYKTRKNFKVIESIFEIAFSFVEGTEDPFAQNVVNGSILIKGGKQDSVLKNKIQHYVNAYVAENFKSIGKFEKDDIVSNFTFMFQVKINEPKFAGQNKSKLDNSELTQFANYFFNKYLKYWINREDKSKMKKLIQLLEANRKARLQSNKIREDVFKEVLNQSDDALLSNTTKLTKCKSKNPKMCELFLAEGDSAKGPIKDSRVVEYQAVLPLKGKLINALKTKKVSALMKNDEIINLVTALGCGIGENYDYSKLKFHKIIIISDKDIDGLHIRNLNLIFLYKFYPDLIRKGHVFIVDAPLYVVKTSKKEYYAWSLSEREEIVSKLTSRFEVTRYKGLGEMNAEQLFDTCLNKNNRRLYQPRLSESENFEDIINILENNEEDESLTPSDLDEINFKYQELINVYMNDRKEDSETRTKLVADHYANTKEEIINFEEPKE